MPSDKQRLDWLARRKWAFYKRDAFQLDMDGTGWSFASWSIRESIDAAMRGEGKP